MSKLIQAISDDTGLSSSDLRRIISTAPHRYKVFEIKKRNNKGSRVVAQPAYELKIVQRWLVDNVFASLPVHDLAIAYRSGVSIKMNAGMHAGKRYVLKMDFSNFFPSIHEKDIHFHLKKYLSDSYSEEDISSISRLTLWAPRGQVIRCLCIGAPSSPILSNSILYEFDKVISEHCKENSVSYSRYADDITFSTNMPNVLIGVEKFVRTIVDSHKIPKLKINEEKTVYASKKKHMHVTGLTLTPSGSVSIGRDKKRAISSNIHRYTLGKLGHKDIMKLKGYLSFANDVEPSFVVRMGRKYGEDVISGIFKYRNESDK